MLDKFKLYMVDFARVRCHCTY